MHACSLSPFTRKVISRDREKQRRSFETALVYLFIIKPVFVSVVKAIFDFETSMFTTVYLHTGALAEFCSFIFIG